MNLRLITRRFNRAASTYDQHAVLAQETARRLIERLHLIRLQPNNIIDLGCGTGFTTRLLQKFYPKANIIGLDISPAMLAQAKRYKRWFRRERLVQANAELLPFAEQSVDLIVSNQLLHWCQPIQSIIKECQRVLKPSGLFFFTCLGPDTLKELKASWRQVDNFAHVHDLTDMHDIGDCLVQSGFADPVMDIEYFSLTYKNPSLLLQELKKIGASNSALNSKKGLSTYKQLQNCYQTYENYKIEEGLYPATFEVIYGHAWAAVQENTTNSTLDNEVRISLDQIRRR